jgi:glycosyltransferase involved in cell wall biosynthesis
VSACIWYVSKYVALPSSGRGGTRAFLLMREMVRLGHDCLILTSDSNHLANVPALRRSSMTETVDGVRVCWIKTRKYVGAKSVGRILSWLDFELRLWRLPKHTLPQPDAVIVSSLSLLTILNGLWLRWRYGCRLIFEVRDIWPLTLIEEGGFSRWNPFVVGLGLIERLGYRKADAVVGTMPNLRAHVDKQVRCSAPVYTVPFGVTPDDVSHQRPVPSDWVTRHIPRGKFIVCHAGTIGITNALDTLFDCARSMRGDPRVHFLIVGDGDLREQYELAVADFGNVTFTGPVPKNMVQSVLAKADLVYFATHPSKVWDYGLSLNKVIDYMLAAKPVIGSYSGFRTMIEEAESGTMVPARDVVALRKEIERYVEMPLSQRVAIGARGRSWLIENRSYAKLAEDYVALACNGRMPIVCSATSSSIRVA